MFGKDVAVNAQPEKTVVKAFARGQAQEGHLRRARERMGPRGAGWSQVGHPGVCCCLPKAHAQCAKKKENFDTRLGPVKIHSTLFDTISTLLDATYTSIPNSSVI